MDKGSYVKPLKKFGQNYLQDKNILNKIVDEFNPQPNNLIIEIGPGQGGLTEFLYEKSSDFYAVEIDTRVIEDLKQRFPKLHLVQADFMEYDFRQFPNKVRVIGNIPYYLTSPILFKLLENREKIEDAVLLMQFEVAERLTAIPGNKEYGILAAIFNAFAEINLCFKVSPNVFFPKPKVYSAVVHLRFVDKYKIKNDKKYIQLVKAAFGQRRKTLKNSLGNSIFRNIDFTSSGIDLTLRAEKLTIPNFITLSEHII